MEDWSDIPHSDSLRVRSANPHDQPLLEALFRSARAQLDALPLPPEQVEQLISQQYRLQQHAYAQRWPRARNFVIECAGVAIGKIMLDDDGAQLHIIDFVLEPAMRGKSYGTAILRTVQRNAGTRPVVLSVDHYNVAARKLYSRLGFQRHAESETHETMIWHGQASRDNEASPEQQHPQEQGHVRTIRR